MAVGLNRKKPFENPVCLWRHSSVKWSDMSKVCTQYVCGSDSVTDTFWWQYLTWYSGIYTISQGCKWYLRIASVIPGKLASMASRYKLCFWPSLMSPWLRRKSIRKNVRTPGSNLERVICPMLFPPTPTSLTLFPVNLQPIKAKRPKKYL